MTGTNPDRGEKFMFCKTSDLLWGPPGLLGGYQAVVSLGCHEADNFHLTPRLKREELYACIAWTETTSLFFNFLSSRIFVGVPVM